jgi:hypothetical protein
LLKNAPAYRQAGICGVFPPPHHLGGVARSHSLFVATPPLILRLSGEFILSLSKRAPCICLPARSRFGEGRGIFEQPDKNDFFSSLDDPPFAAK